MIAERASYIKPRGGTGVTRWAARQKEMREWPNQIIFYIFK